jgi:RNA polymerase-binding transcription factor DksA
VAAGTTNRRAWQAGGHDRLDDVTESGTSWADRGPQAADPGGAGSTATDTAGATAPAPVDNGLVVLEQIERELVEVDAALVRLDEGTYGACRVCAAAIDDAVLAERPTTDVCAAHDAPVS